MSQRIDLHTHSHCSDGSLDPRALVASAAARQVELLAVTDHDTVGGCAAAREACQVHGIEFVSGVELTCQWREREIHIVGLGVDDRNPGLNDHCGAALEQRRRRVGEIARRLSAAGLPGDLLTREALNSSAPTRRHIARAICSAGMTDTVQRAFDRWLNRGRPGYVAVQWPALEAVVRCLIDAGGVAVLAHPHRYRVSNGVLCQLVEEFTDAGGSGLEVSLAGMGPSDADRAATLARRFDLAGSIGSDFHEPDLPWRPLGRFAKLPEGVRPIAEHLGLVNRRS